MKKIILAVMLLLMFIISISLNDAKTYVTSATAFNATADAGINVTIALNTTVLGANITISPYNYLYNDSYAGSITANTTSIAGISMVNSTGNYFATNFNTVIHKLNATGGEISHLTLNETNCVNGFEIPFPKNFRGVHAIDDDSLYVVASNTTSDYLLKIQYNATYASNNYCLDYLRLQLKDSTIDPDFNLTSGVYVNDAQTEAVVTSRNIPYVYVMDIHDCANDCMTTLNWTVTTNRTALDFDYIDKHDGNYFASYPATGQIYELDDSFDEVSHWYVADTISGISGQASNLVRSPYGIDVNGSDVRLSDSFDIDEIGLFKLRPHNLVVSVGDSVVYRHDGNFISNSVIDLNTTAIADYLTTSRILPLIFEADEWGGALITNLSIETESEIELHAYDEQNYEALGNTIYIEIFGSGTGYNYTMVGNMSISGLPLDVYELRYYATGYPRRSHFLNLNDTRKENIDLFLLNSTGANNDYKTVQVVDESANYVEGAIVEMQRRYVECGGCYRTVEMTKTDVTGDAYLFTELYDATYRFKIYDNWNLKKITNSTTLDTRSLYFKIILSNYGVDSYFTVIEDVDAVIDEFDDDTNVWSFSYDDTTGSNVQSARLKVVKQGSYSDDVICDSTASGSIGTLTCNQTAYVNQTGQFIATGYVTTSDGAVYVVDEKSFAYVRDYVVYGGMGLLLSFVIVGVMALLALWSPSAAIVSTILGLVLVSAAGLLYIQLTMLVGAVVVGAIIIMQVKR